MPPSQDHPSFNFQATRDGALMVVLMVMPGICPDYQRHLSLATSQELPVRLPPVVEIQNHLLAKSGLTMGLRCGGLLSLARTDFLAGGRRLQPWRKVTDVHIPVLPT